MTFQLQTDKKFFQFSTFFMDMNPAGDGSRNQSKNHSAKCTTANWTATRKLRFASGRLAHHTSRFDPQETDDDFYLLIKVPRRWPSQAFYEPGARRPSTTSR